MGTVVTKQFGVISCICYAFLGMSCARSEGDGALIPDDRFGAFFPADAGQFGRWHAPLRRLWCVSPFLCAPATRSAFYDRWYGDVNVTGGVGADVLV
jgi:hypothetical protein